MNVSCVLTIFQIGDVSESENKTDDELYDNAEDEEVWLP